jgi:membrane-associated protease RseP (regulator of RpoE activity)
MMSSIFANPEGYLPQMNEMSHYPFLNVGWFGIFLTSMNMLPLGQLDGGHVAYAMFGGKRQFKIAKIVWKIMFILGISGVLNEFRLLLSLDITSTWYLALQNIFLPPLNRMKTEAPILLSGWTGWIVWCMITKYFIKLKHHPIWDPEKIDDKRRMIGWIAFLILILSFSYNGIYML